MPEQETTLAQYTHLGCFVRVFSTPYPCRQRRYFGYEVEGEPLHGTRLRENFLREEEEAHRKAKGAIARQVAAGD